MAYVWRNKNCNMNCNRNIPFTSTKADVANWRKQLQLKFRLLIKIAILVRGIIEIHFFEKKKDNQYKLKQAMAITIGLMNGGIHLSPIK